MDNYEDVSAVETTAVDTPELSPAEMFFNDLSGNTDDVSEEYVEQPVEEQTSEVSEVAEAQPEVEAQAPSVPEEEPVYQPQMATMDDINNAKESILQEILRMAQEEEAREEAEDAMEDAMEEKEPEMSREELQDKYYDNPLDVVEQLASKMADEKVQAVMDQLQPLLEKAKIAQERQSITDVITNFMENTPDAREYMDEMVPYIKENGLDPNDINSFVNTYRDMKLARQGNLINQLSQNQGKSLEDYLGDEESLAKILDNDNIKSKIIENYLKDIQNGAKPQTISSGGSVQAVGTEPNKPQTFKDASEMFKASFNR